MVVCLHLAKKLSSVARIAAEMAGSKSTVVAVGLCEDTLIIMCVLIPRFARAPSFTGLEGYA